MSVSQNPRNMPPPGRIFKQGSLELQNAVELGDVELSLPKDNWEQWIASNPNEAPHRSPSSLSTFPREYPGLTKNRSHLVEHSTSEETQPANEDDTCMSDTKMPRFHDIVGHDAIKERLDEVLLPLALPPSIAKQILQGVRSLAASILMFGPPGCGKTQMARAIAGEAEAAFLSVGPSDILSKYVGESEASIRTLFQTAYEQAAKMNNKCAVLFFDEIDALGQTRGSSCSSPAASDTSSRRVLAELLLQLNRVNSAPYVEVANPEDSALKATVRVIVVAATNRPEDCDPALLRRFSVRVLVDVPTAQDRQEIFTRYLKGIEHSLTSDQLQALAMHTDGWTGSDLESLTREAAMAPIRECIRAVGKMQRSLRNSSNHNLQEKFLNLRPVCMHDFQLALEFIALNSASDASSIFPANQLITQDHLVGSRNESNNI
eukprot:Nitzschia sp. Nitz4//scaffold2_size372955//159091//160464//NITZ4_000413-RA/size372955-snap-gene-0.27-mRNA-1//1//CDS//3329546748//3707//frame0